jgi:hypothetical protein
MALQKTISTDYGNATYWKVHYFVDTRLELVHVTLKGYENQTAEQNGNSSRKDISFSPSTSDVTLVNKAPTVSDIYTWIKTLDGSNSQGILGGGYDWTDATDV